MGKSTPAPPPAPDATKIAAAQSAGNLNSAIGSQILNQTGQNTPYGSVNYAQTGTTNVGGLAVPQFTQNVKLSPNQQAILNQTEGLQQSALGAGGQAISNVAASIGSPFSLKGLPEAPKSIKGGNVTTSFNNPNQQMSLDTSGLPDIPGINDFGAQRDATQNALMSRFNEDWDKQQENSKSTLNAQGLQLGSEAYGDEMAIQGRNRNDALMQSILGSGAEQQRLFDMASTARGQTFEEQQLGGQFANDAAAQQFAQNQGQAAFGNAAENQKFTQNLAGAQYQQAARQNSLSEQALMRSQPINEFSTLFGLGGQVNVPGGAAQTGVGVNPADILGANALQYQALQNNYNQQMGANNAKTSALGSAAGAIGGAALIF